MPTQLSIANRSLTEIARGNPLTGGNVASNFDGTASGIYVATLYQGAVELLLRQSDWEFSRASIALTDTGAPPPLQWTNEYLYPADCLKIRQVYPATWDPFDPQPIRWDVATRAIAAVQTRTILTSIAGARLIYTTNAVTESEFDAGFTEHLVRYLGSMLALPVAGRPDFSREQLKIAGGIGSAMQDKDT